MMLSYHEYLSLARKLFEAGLAYHRGEDSSLTDEEYDRLYRELIQIEKENPQWIVHYSPSQYVGAALSEESHLERQDHRVLMGSLDNVFDQDEFRKWALTCLLTEHVEFVGELKIDGLAVSLIYEHGLLVKATTRGDGKTGESVLLAIQTIRNCPAHLHENFSGEIRGEVCFKTQDFLALNEMQKKKGLKEFSHPRNAAAGSLRLIDLIEVAKRPLSFVAYTLLEHPHIETHHEALQWLQSQGFEVSHQIFCGSDLQDAIDFYWNVLKKRKELPYGIDGIVFKVNAFQVQKKLGETARSPRWAIAWKCPADEYMTVLRDIHIQVGRLGAITPVADLDPVFIDAVLVKSATLHNFHEIFRKNLKIGALVRVRRAGDVIPEVVGLAQEDSQAAFTPVQIPEKCPSCGRSLEEKDSGLWCMGEYDCPEQRLQRLVYSCSRDALDVSGLSIETLKKLLQKYPHIMGFADLMLLTESQWTALDGVGPILAQKIQKQLNNAFSLPPARILLAFGVRHVGKVACEQLFQSLSWHDFLQGDLHQYRSIYGFGEVMAESLAQFVQSEFFQNQYEKMSRLGFQCEHIPLIQQGALTGQRIVITGSFPEYSRSDLSAWMIQRGASVSESVSTKTTLVIVGENPGSKKEKASHLKIRMIEGQEALSDFMKRYD